MLDAVGVTTVAAVVLTMVLASTNMRRPSEALARRLLAKSMASLSLRPFLDLASNFPASTEYAFTDHIRFIHHQYVSFY